MIVNSRLLSYRRPNGAAHGGRPGAQAPSAGARPARAPHSIAAQKPASRPAEPAGGGFPSLDAIQRELGAVRQALTDLINRATAAVKPAQPPAPAAPPVQEGGKGPVLAKGLTGDPVKRLQERLGELGFDAGGADGQFGPNTDAAVKAFQQSRGLAVDGVVGPDTWNKLGITVTGEVHGATPSAGPDGATVQTVDGPMVGRQGKLISPQIAANFDRMVAAAAREGISIEINDGYRSSEEQAVLYQLYKSGKGPIAAPPGQSLHNKGLAIDFYDRPGAWAWLKAHATDYGFKNFDPEPWHYSVTGG
jgi:peptidoglycan hydrolase-like protein with peptidoglycan-binding domain